MNEKPGRNLRRFAPAINSPPHSAAQDPATKTTELNKSEQVVSAQDTKSVPAQDSKPHVSAQDTTTGLPVVTPAKAASEPLPQIIICDEALFIETVFG